MKHAHAIAWLKASTVFTIGFGLFMVAAAVPALSAPMTFFLDLVFYPLDGTPTWTDPATRLLGAIGGGVMVGWGATMWLVITRLAQREPGLASSMILAGVCVWFVADSTGSILSGAHWNAVANIGFLLIFLIPALQLRRALASLT